MFSKQAATSAQTCSVAPSMQEGEDPGLSRPITENLNAVLQLLQYREVCAPAGRQSAVPLPNTCMLSVFPTVAARLQIHELSLSGNQLRSDMLRERLRFEAGDSLTNDSWPGAGPAGGLHPAQELDTGEMARLQEGAQVIDCSSEFHSMQPLLATGNLCLIQGPALASADIGRALLPWLQADAATASCWSR